MCTGFFRAAQILMMAPDKEAPRSCQSLAGTFYASFPAFVSDVCLRVV